MVLKVVSQNKAKCYCVNNKWYSTLHGQYCFPRLILLIIHMNEKLLLTIFYYFCSSNNGKFSTLQESCYSGLTGLINFTPYQCND
jgi:hypothetical protein